MRRLKSRKPADSSTTAATASAPVPGTRAVLRQAMDDRRSTGTGFLTADAALSEARLWISLGDSAVAAAVLDAALGSLRAQALRTFSDPPTAASVRAAGLLRARLSKASRDGRDAALWGEALASIAPRTTP